MKSAHETRAHAAARAIVAFIWTQQADGDWASPREAEYQIVEAMGEEYQRGLAEGRRAECDGILAAIEARKIYDKAAILAVAHNPENPGAVK